MKLDGERPNTIVVRSCCQRSGDSVSNVFLSRSASGMDTTLNDLLTSQVALTGLCRPACPIIHCIIEYRSRSEAVGQPDCIHYYRIYLQKSVISISDDK